MVVDDGMVATAERGECGLEAEFEWRVRCELGGAEGWLWRTPTQYRDVRRGDILAPAAEVLIFDRRSFT